MTPLQKVLSMMKEMKAHGIQEKQDEEVRFSAFSQWCTTTQKVKQEAIDRGSREIEDRSAAIEKAAADMDELGERVAELNADVARLTEDEKAAAEVRGKEKVDFMATFDEYKDVLDACDRAIQVLKNLKDVKQSSFLQGSVNRLLQSSHTPDKARQALSSFLQGNQDPHLAKTAPKANAYESHSGGVAEMLAELRKNFQDEKDALQKEEMEAEFAFQKITQKLQADRDMAEQEIERKTKNSAKLQEQKAQDEGAKDEAVRVQGEDSLFLTQTKGLCVTKSQDFEQRSKLRADEIDALDKAIEIISGLKEPTEVASFAQTQKHGKHKALAQLRANRATNADLKKALALLRARAATTHSDALAVLAQQASMVVTKDEDPFGKVKGMISAMIKKLMEQANGEADHKGWCDAELATNKQARQHKTDEVTELMTNIEGLQAEIAQLSEDLEDLAAQIAEAQRDMAEADATRATEKVKNAQVVQESKESAEAVASALSVLRDFYARAAEATALSQVRQSPSAAPETFNAGFQGQQAQSSGIIGMLEVLESDFSRLSSETATEDAVAQANYEKFRADSEQDMAVNNAEMEHKQNKKQQRELELGSDKATLSKANDELDASVSYYEKLRPSCVDSGVSYEQRVADREAEIQSMKEAYKIISGEDIPSIQDMKAEQLR